MFIVSFHYNLSSLRIGICFNDPHVYHVSQHLQGILYIVLFLFSCWVVSDSLSSTVSQSLFKFMSIESVIQSNHLILCCPLLLLPSIFPSIMVFSNESALHIRWPKYWSFSFSINPPNEYLGLIFFRIDWFDLLAVQVTPKSRLQHHS